MCVRLCEYVRLLVKKTRIQKENRENYRQTVKWRDGEQKEKERENERE